MKNNPSFFLVIGFTESGNDVTDAGSQAAQIVNIIDEVAAKYNIDTKRLYLTGQSMGGIIDFSLNYTYPEKFAATVFVGCGSSGSSGGEAGSKDGLKKVNIVSPTSLASMDLCWIYAADGLGFFKDEGIEVNMIESTDGSDPKILGSGQADFGAFSPSVGLTAVQSGVDNVEGICNVVAYNMFGIAVNKTGGDSSNTENSEFYGVNAGILTTKGSTTTIKNSKITTNAKGANAIFATGEDAKVYISNTTITTTGKSSSRGLDATYGGYIEADNVTITTQGGSCATLATDRGEGTVIAKNSKLETNGSGSPIIYSTGNISISNTTGTSNGSQMVVIEGKNSATVEDSTLVCSGKGNRGDTDHAGIMIYQSMSGDASEGTGTFTAKNSSLTISENSNYYKTAPMFFITNTDAIINLTNTKLNYGSNLLISNKGTSEWGNSGSNGGNLTLNATKQELTGNVEVDNISTLTMNLNESSSYTGTINSANTAKSITLKLDSSSKITLTGDSYVTSLEDSDSSYSNINFNGYKLYVNGTAIN